VLSLGDLMSLQAILVFDDGSSEDVTGEAQWRSNNERAVATDNGSLGLNNVGTATISASFGGFSGSSEVTVSGARLQSVAIVPGSVSVAVGETRPLGLSGLYEDGSTREIGARATWASSQPGVARVAGGTGAPGAVTGVAAGTTTITATVQGQHASAMVTVP
jgi:hypothetical protein